MLRLIFVFAFALAASAQFGGGGGVFGGGSSASVTYCNPPSVVANCINKTDASGNLPIGTTVPVPDGTWNPTGPNLLVGNQGSSGQKIFLQVAFQSADDTKLYLLASSDGKSWGMVGRGGPMYTAGSGHTRDPRIMYWGGKYWICFTNQSVAFGTGSTFTIISSPDLVNWTTVATPSLAGTVSGSLTVWSPKWFVDLDGSIRIIVDVSNTGADTGFINYILHPTDTTGLTTWSDGTAVTGTDLPNNVLDGGIVRRPSDPNYYFWYKNENTNYIEYMTCASLSGDSLGGCAVTKSGNWAGWGSGLEGWSLIRPDSSTWRIYFDLYTGGGMYYSDSADWSTWTSKVQESAPAPMSNSSFQVLTDEISQRAVMAAAYSYAPGNSSISPVPSRQASSLVMGYFPGANSSLVSEPFSGYEGMLLNSNIVYNSSVGNWTSQDTGKAGWQQYMIYGSTGDGWGVCRAPGTGGASSFVCGLTMGSDSKPVFSTVKTGAKVPVCMDANGKIYAGNNTPGAVPCP